MDNERLFIITYDIADERRWRRVFKAMHGYGEWLQLSVFQCRLSRRRRAELETRLRELVKNGEDHVLLIDVGPADKVELAMESIGKTFSKMERRARQGQMEFLPEIVVASGMQFATRMGMVLPESGKMTDSVNK